MSSRGDIVLKVVGDTRSYQSSLRTVRSSARGFASGMKREFQSIGNAWRSVTGQLATLGVGFGLYKTAADSAKLTKQLIRMGQTAGVSRERVAGLRKELFVMTAKTGQSVADLADGFNSLIQSGQSWDEALSTIKAINTAMAVTGANADTLAKGMTTAATAFGFDLSKVDVAAALLDKMTVAGRYGNAELENLSDIFARVAVNAKSAGMSFDSTLAFVEALSQIEKSPERLATLADSTLRLFTNQAYMKRAQKETKIDFFDAQGSRRAAVDVLEDIRTQYQKLSTEEQRSDFMGRVFKGADLDTIRGMRMLLSGTMLESMRKFSKGIAEAGGTLEKEVGSTLDNAEDSARRLGGILKKAGDDFAKPVNEAVSKAIQHLINEKDKGGLGLSGGQLLTIGALGLGGAYVGGRVLKGAMGKLLGGGTSAAMGIAQGKAIEEMTGVQPVFVTNWPGSFGGTAGPAAARSPVALPSRLGWLRGAAPLLGWGAAVGVGMYGMGKLGQRQFINEQASSGNLTADQLQALSEKGLLGEEKARGYASVQAFNEASIAAALQQVNESRYGKHQGPTIPVSVTINQEISSDGRTKSSVAGAGARLQVNSKRRGDLSLAPAGGNN